MWLYGVRGGKGGQRRGAGGGGGHLVRAASRDEDALLAVLLKVPGLNAILCLQLPQMLAAQVEGLHERTFSNPFAQVSVPGCLCQSKLRGGAIRDDKFEMQSRRM